MRAVQTIPAWTPAVAIRLVPLGIRTVVRKQNNAVYVYRYLRFDPALFPEVSNARRIRLVLVPPDFTAPPIIITARLFRQGKHVQGFIIDSAYQRVVANYARNDHVGVIAIEAIDPEKEIETSGAL